MNKILSFVIVFSLFLLKFFSRFSLIDPRFIVCAKNLDYDKTFLSLTYSGCYYSKFVFMLFVPFTNLHAEFYYSFMQFILILFYLVNCLIVFKIADLLKVDKGLLFLFYGLLIIFFGDGFWQIHIVTSTLVNLAFLLFLFKQKKSFFFSGFLICLTGLLKPFPLFLFLSIMISYFIFNLKLKGRKIFVKGLSKISFFFLGGLLTLPFYLASPSYLTSLYYTSISVGLGFGLVLKPPLFIIFFVFFLTLFKNKKSLFDISLLINTIILIYFIIDDFRFFFESLLLFSLPLTKYLSRLKKRRILIVLFIFIAFLYIPSFLRRIYLNPLRELFNNQFLLISDEKNILLYKSVRSKFLEFAYNSPALADPILFEGFIKIPNYEWMISEFNEWVDLSNFEIIIINQIIPSHDLFPEEFSEVLVLNYLTPDLYSIYNSTILFKDLADKEKYLVLLNEYWLDNHELLCAYGPHYYDKVKTIFGYNNITLPECV